MRRFAFAFLALAILFAPAPSQAANKVALVIGNNAYEHVTPLNTAVNDARAIGAELKKLGFSVQVAENLTQRAMSRTLVEFENATGPGDVALVFFAGHGFAVKGSNYVLPVDVPNARQGQEELVRDAAFEADRISDRLRERGAGTVVLVLDACRDNPFAAPGTRAAASTRGLARMDPSDGVFVLFSAGQRQAALDRLSDKDPDPNSVFTRAFVAELRRPGRTLVEIAKGTQLSVKKLAASVGFTQTPAYYDQVIGDAVLNAGAGADPGPAVAVAPTIAPSPPQQQQVAINLPRADVRPPADRGRAVALYEEARSAEARGDALAARRAYLALAELDLDVIDPHLRFSSVLRVQDGRAGAREVYGSLRERFKAPAVALIYAMQFEDAERRRRLEEFVQAHPAYGPAQYLLAQEFGEDRAGTPTLAERRREVELLQAFMRFQAEGGLAQKFLDQSVAADWIDRAKRRLAAAEGAIGTAFAPQATFMRSNSGWSATVQLPEAALGMRWRIGETGAFTEVGTLPTVDPRSGKPMPNPTLTLPRDQEQATIYVAYTDLRGAEAGPFPISFHPDSALYGQMRQTLDLIKGSWVEFRDFNGLLVYYTMLVSYRCAIKEARYGLDGAAPSKALPIPVCDPKNPHAIPSNVSPYFKVPTSTKNLTLQLTFSDGTQSAVETFRR
jgi:hypothetical protein